MVCKPCHKTLHATLTNKELENEYNTREAILAHPEIAKFVRWVRKHNPTGNVAVRRSGGRSGRRDRKGRAEARRTKRGDL